MTARIERCRICGNSQLAPILSLGEQSLTGLFPRSDDGPVTIAPLELVKCTPANGERTCGLVQLRHSFDSNVMYGANYGYRSSLNPSMVAHLREIVEQLAARVELHPGDLVIDIGSNDGTLLSFYQPGPTFIGGVLPSSTRPSWATGPPITAASRPPPGASPRHPPGPSG